MEKSVGVRFREDDFRQALKLSDEAAALWVELLDVRAAVPSPVGSREMCGNVFPRTGCHAGQPHADTVF